MAPSTRPGLMQRHTSTLHYQTFPTAPPSSRGKPPPSSSSPTVSRADSRRGSQSSNPESPLPKRQLAILAVIALAEQTALNSISPYLPDMASSFPEVDESQVGLYVGLIASSFALAQFATNFFWGWLSDRIGRKPVVLIGTFLTAACFVAFGFCRTLWQAILVQVFMGLANGNQAIISTCLGEITDRSNQSRAFTYLPVLYGIGSITGPIVGGLLVMRRNPFDKSKKNPYPYLPPNLMSAGVLLIDLILTMIFLEESLEGAKDLPPLGKRAKNLFTWLWQSHSSTQSGSTERAKVSKDHYRPLHANGSAPEAVEESEAEEDSADDEGSSHAPALFPDSSAGEHLTTKQILNRDTVLLLITFLIFQLSNISYNSLYPIFAQAPPPTGRSLHPSEIGLSLAFAGVITIVFQVGLFGKLREKIGNRTAYRVGLGGFVVAFWIMPLVGYKDGGKGTGRTTQGGKVWLWFELGAVLAVKTVAAVGALTSALLLITNSAPNHAVLGTLNGLAQTLSAAGRAAGPFMSGSLFTAATHVKPKGEALAFGVFGGISFIGFLLSFGIRGHGLEAEGWESGSDEDSGSGSRSGSGSGSGSRSTREAW
ncbi:hypothetical protein LTR66_014677 [Elasticomyces elasticus]|nr:hypothetical protein LTR66_014677 [Elasticomyces elasticus]